MLYCIELYANDRTAKGPIVVFLSPVFVRGDGQEQRGGIGSKTFECMLIANAHGKKATNGQMNRQTKAVTSSILQLPIAAKNYIHT